MQLESRSEGRFGVSAQLAQATQSTSTSETEKDAIHKVASGYYDALWRRLCGGIGIFRRTNFNCFTQPSPYAQHAR